MLSTRDIEEYRQYGFRVVPNVLSMSAIARLRKVTDSFVENARSVTSNDDTYDLEDAHSFAEPRVRRIKTPERQHPEYAAAASHPDILAVLRDLWGPDIRFQIGKLNLKSAGFGSPVEWHQDWAFYPHTNDDLAAVSIMLDDCELENGPLMVIPGSHRGPIYDHHANGRFCGAIDASTSGLDFANAIPLTGKAGSITIHHVRAVHGSAPNLSSKDRRLLFFQYRAADAWPLLGFPSIEAFDALMLCGRSTLEPRLAPIPVRLPLPPAEGAGSIYEAQRAVAVRYFAMPKGVSSEQRAIS